MKIAFFNYLPLEYGGGTSKYFIDTACELLDRNPGMEISIVTFNESVAKKVLFLYSIYYGGKQDTRLDNKEKSQEIQQSLKNVEYKKAKSLADLRKILGQFDLVYSKNDIFEACLLKLIGVHRLVPIIFGFHTPISYPSTLSLQSCLHNLLYGSPIYGYLIRKATKFHVLNTADEAILRKQFSSDKVVKIPNPFDFDGFVNKANIYKYKHKWDKGVCNILWVGRLTEQKGVKDLLEVIDVINQSYESKVSWNIVGEGEYRSSLTRYIKKWKNIYYFGYVQNNYLADIYKNNDLFISTSKWESYPYTLLEAQAMGLPVVVYNIPGNRDIVRNKKTGYLVNTKTEFVEKIYQVIHSEKFKKTVISHYVQKDYDTAIIIEKLYSLFSSAVREK